MSKNIHFSRQFVYFVIKNVSQKIFFYFFKFSGQISGTPEKLTAAKPSGDTSSASVKPTPHVKEQLAAPPTDTPKPAVVTSKEQVEVDVPTQKDRIQSATETVIPTPPMHQESPTNTPPTTNKAVTLEENEAAAHRLG